MEKDTCSTCGSTKIIHDAAIADLAHGNQKKELSIHIQKTDNRFFNKFEKGALKAKICCSCGKVDLSVENPQALWEAHLKTKNI
ncbi:hypothetical protein [Winogradskyella immobilis]|uniref:Uncharacterized protein n=1 Tax=Winogradskyella immobilis TaxID=2816852 RepID=A0ABS8ELK1_9FLAO|nr:hypothetical protein [Winogradskyella immobilis]MCC1483440.1 hypothetical protein [Winogradskyella immobilis]MCG0015534.1 hypothetical protein [Winogradskyella immobilis]